MANASKQPDWTKPAAMAIPKEGYFNLSRAGRPDLSANAGRGFTIIAKIKPGRRQIIRAYGKTIEKTIREPDALAVLKLHYLRWVLFDIGGDVLHVPGHLRYGFRQVHRGRGRAVLKDGRQHDLREARRIPDGLEDERAGVHQVRPRAPVPELPRIRRISVRHAPTKSRRRSR